MPAVTANAAAATGKRHAANHAAEARRGQSSVWRRVAWFGLLLSAICLEGLGRRYLRQIPPTTFYFIKDIVLGMGLLFGVSPEITRVINKLYGGAKIFLVLGLLWTIFQAFNPLQGSFSLALVGLRSYWLWWLAPLVISSVLLDPQTRKGAIYMLALVSLTVCVFAVAQFGAPPDSDLNTYSITVDGDAVVATAVSTTGRARVASTFSFITGFSDFTIIVPPLLLTIGLSEPDRKLRLIGLLGAATTAAVLPMSGSRAPLFIAGALITIIAWSAGFLFTAAGRRIVMGAVIAVISAVTVYPEALQGVFDRMESDDTTSRIDDTLRVLPPVALTKSNYPFWGIGTGMQHNARQQFFIRSLGWESENEYGKYLIELGAPGYLLCWLARFGISLALLRASFLLRRAGRGAPAGAAIGFSALNFFGNLVFDHIWQSLYFVAVSYIVVETTLAYRSLQAASGARTAAKAAPAPPWTPRRTNVG